MLKILGRSMALRYFRHGLLNEVELPGILAVSLGSFVETVKSYSPYAVRRWSVIPSLSSRPLADLVPSILSTEFESELISFSRRGAGDHDVVL